MYPADCRQIKQVFKIIKAFKIIIDNTSVLEKEICTFSCLFNLILKYETMR